MLPPLSSDASMARSLAIHTRPPSLAAFLVHEIQQVYRLQGVAIAVAASPVRYSLAGECDVCP